MAKDSHIIASDNCTVSNFPGSIESANGGNDDDILRQLDFSVHDLLDPADDPDLSLWDLDEIFNFEAPSSLDATAPTEFVSDQNSTSSCATIIQSSNDLCYSGCSLLRQVIHSDGVQSMKLSIHGVPGVFCHATLAVCDNSSVPPVEPYCINLRERTFEQVKLFLIEYGMLRMQDKCYLIEDSLSAFYEALCVRFIDETTASTSNTAHHLPQQDGLCESRPPEVSDQEQILKSGVAAQLVPSEWDDVFKSDCQATGFPDSVQRERTGKMKLCDLAKFFHLPIMEASKELKLCPTAIKKVCRKYGLPRWPYRKVRSIDKNMEKLLQEIPERDEQDVSQIISEVAKLEERKARIYRGH